MKMTVIAATLMVLAFTGVSSADNWEKFDKPVPTKIVVRVLSHGAKAMSQHTGAVVFIFDNDGNLLDKGMVQGSTGDTTALMKAGYPRMFGAVGLLKGEKGMLFEDAKASDKKHADNYYDTRDAFKPEDNKPVAYESKEDAAKYETTIEISKPTLITVKAQGPLMPQQSMTVSTQTFMLFPGQDITGEGIVVELRGLIVDAAGSMREAEVNVTDPAQKITVPFFMRMLCGCPIAPAGRTPWEAEGYNITTQAFYKGKMYHEETVTSDKIFVDVSSFATSVPLPKDLPAGSFSKEMVKVRILAAQPDQSNFGLDEVNVYLTRK